MKYGLVLAITCLSACNQVDPLVCNVIQMSEGEYAAYEALPASEQVEHCAIQVISDEPVEEVQFGIREAGFNP